MPKALDITGEKYHKLTAVRYSHKEGKERIWMFVCDCGNEYFAPVGKVRFGSARSCGCLKKDVLKDRNTSHGMRHTSEYEAWRGAKRRVKGKDSKRRKYEENNITMQEDWFNDFMTFYEYIGPKPSPSHSLGRIDNFKGYEEGNVRWETPEEQARNHSKQANNKTGVVGVHAHSSHGGKYESYVANLTMLGKDFSKSFSVGKFGEELAFFLACEQRDQWMLINEMCFGTRFADTHGLSKEEYDARQ